VCISVGQLVLPCRECAIVKLDSLTPPPLQSPFRLQQLRVCDRCIEDDKGIGRIRICGVCGTVACDEYCGPVLVECTDSPEWNNAGCIEWYDRCNYNFVSILYTVHLISSIVSLHHVVPNRYPPSVKVVAWETFPNWIYSNGLPTRRKILE
jgi:hypothetical protein